MKKTYLLTPGPTPVPERVSAAMSQPIIHHRTPEFKTLFQEIRTGLKYLFQTTEEVLILSGSGTAAMDAAVSNVFTFGDCVITINAGKFGERWTKIAKSYQLHVVEIFVERGKAVDLQILKKTLKENPETKAVLFQASETATGALQPTQEIIGLCKQYNALSICDAITACGVFELPMDAWGIDILITGSQKALMIPPGLSFISLSKNAWIKSKSCNIPHFYIDLKKELKAHLQNQTAWSPATSLVVGLQESLKMIQSETLPIIFKRHLKLAQATRAGIEAMGLMLLSKDCPSNAVTAVKIPTTISDGKQIPEIMRKKWGTVIAGGQDELEGKIFRLSHFGYCGPFDVVTAISSLELTLRELGYQHEFGKGVGAVLTEFSKD